MTFNRRSFFGRICGLLGLPLVKGDKPKTDSNILATAIPDRYGYRKEVPVTKDNPFGVEYVDQYSCGWVWLNEQKLPCVEFRLRAKSAEIICSDRYEINVPECNVTATGNLEKALANGGIRLDPVCSIQLKNAVMRSGRGHWKVVGTETGRFPADGWVYL